MPARANTRMPPDGNEPREFIPSLYQAPKWGDKTLYMDHYPPTEQRDRRPRAGWGNKFATTHNPPIKQWRHW